MPDTQDQISVPTTARKASLALILLMLVLGAAHSWGAWQLDNQAAERLVASRTRALEFQTDSTFRAADGLLSEASQRIDPDHWPDPALLSWFQSRLVAFPEIHVMAVFRANGQSAGRGLTANGLVGQPVDASDRQHFRLVKSGQDEGGMVVGDPISDRFEGLQLFPLARAIRDGNGTFKGMVAVGINPSVMVKGMEALKVEDSGGISVIRRDGIILARLPDQYGSFGRSVAKSDLFTKYLADSPSGIARFVSVSDGNTKIVGFRTLANFPVVATVGITQTLAFAQYRMESMAILAAIVLVSLALFWMATLSDRREHARILLAHRLERQSESLERQVQERTRHLEELSREAEHKARLLAASNADLEQFTSIASHDLQEPLRTVASYVQLLQNRYDADLPPEAKEYIAYAVAGAKRMHHLIQDLLAYSQVSAQEEAFQRCSLAEIAAAAVDGLQKSVTESGAHIRIDPLPEVEGDRQRLATLFRHLIANAIKYRKPDVAPDIGIGAIRTGQDWTIRVSDNGIGIAPEYLERIFVIFQRLHGMAEYDGTGIGLTLCKRIVERHGGHIWVESEPDKGTDVLFTLPVSAEKTAGP